MLCDLFLQRTISRDQIIALGYFGSVPRCNSRLRQLLDHGFVRRYGHASHGSGSQALYCLDRAGSTIVADRLEIEIAEALQQVRRDTPALFLEHTLGLVDLRIQFTRQASLQELENFEWLPEPLCRHEYSIREQSGAWKPQLVKPDAFVRWSGGAEPHCFFVELDLGHVSQAAFGRKVESYRRYLNLGVFARAYETASFEVLVVTTGERRLAHLQETATASVSPRFLFTTLDRLHEAGPFAPVWKCGRELIVLPGGDR